jgi:hypothetical protein
MHSYDIVLWVLNTYDAAIGDDDATTTPSIEYVADRLVKFALVAKGTVTSPYTFLNRYLFYGDRRNMTVASEGSAKLECNQFQSRFRSGVAESKMYADLTEKYGVRGTGKTVLRKLICVLYRALDRTTWESDSQFTPSASDTVSTLAFSLHHRVSDYMRKECLADTTCAQIGAPPDVTPHVMQLLMLCRYVLDIIDAMGKTSGSEKGRVAVTFIESTMRFIKKAYTYITQHRAHAIAAMVADFVMWLNLVRGTKPLNMLARESCGMTEGDIGVMRTQITRS